MMLMLAATALGRDLRLRSAGCSPGRGGRTALRATSSCAPPPGSAARQEGTTTLKARQHRHRQTSLIAVRHGRSGDWTHLPWWAECEARG